MECFINFKIRIHFLAFLSTPISGLGSRRHINQNPSPSPLWLRSKPCDWIMTISNNRVIPAVITHDYWAYHHACVSHQLLPTTNEETEAPNGQVACPRSQSKLMVALGVESQIPQTSLLWHRDLLVLWDEIKAKRSFFSNTNVWEEALRKGLNPPDDSCRCGPRMGADNEEGGDPRAGCRVQHRSRPPFWFRASTAEMKNIIGSLGAVTHAWNT